MAAMSMKPEAVSIGAPCCEQLRDLLTRLLQLGDVLPEFDVETFERELLRFVIVFNGADVGQGDSEFAQSSDLQEPEHM